MASWRALYKTEWESAAKRVEYVATTLKSWCPQLRIEKGFMADSTQYILVGAPEGHEKGEPDLKIFLNNKHLINIEVTGSGYIYNKKLWLRPDKVVWALNNLIPKTWAWFVYKDKEFIIPVTDVKIFPIKEINLRGVVERYHEIPQGDAYSPFVLKKLFVSKCKK